MNVEYQNKYSLKDIANGIPAIKKYENVHEKHGKYYKTIDGKLKEICFEEDIKNVILDWYNTISNPAALSGRDKLFAAIREKYVGISRRDIASVLANMENSQVHQVARVVTISRPITLKAPLIRWSCDLTFVQNADDEPIFTLLTCIDNFSKYAWAEIVHSGTKKFTGPTVIAAMKKYWIKKSPICRQLYKAIMVLNLRRPLVNLCQNMASGKYFPKLIRQDKMPSLRSQSHFENIDWQIFDNDGCNYK